MRSKIALFIFFLQLPALGVAQSIQSQGHNESDFCSKDVDKRDEKKVGEYHIRISYAGDRTCQRFEILKHNQIVFHEEGFDHHYFLGNDDDSKHFMMNLTGHGSQLVIKKWTGGAHCCMSLLIFDLGSEFRKIDEIYGGNFDPEIVDLDHDGIPEIRITDDFLAYRFSSFAYSAKGNVVLKFTDGRYSVASEFMKKPAPPRGKLNAKVSVWRKLLRKQSSPDWPPPSMIQYITDLIYTGNKKVAFELVDRAWPEDVAGKANFLSSYREALAESKYYGEFEKKQQ